MSIEDRFSSPETIESPYDYYDTLREQAPVYFSPTLGAYFISRYDDVRQVLSNPDVFSSSPRASEQMFTNFAEKYQFIYRDKGTCAPLQTLVTTDGDSHRRYRRAVDRTFSPKALQALTPLLDATIDSLIDTFIHRERVDIYQEFCLKLPLYVICDVVGLPHGDAALLRRGADAAARLAVAALETEETKVALHNELADLHLYFQRYIDIYRAAPADNLLSRLIHTVPEDGTPLDDQELISLLTVLNVGGNETTTNGLGNSFLLCFGNAELQQRLRDDPAQIPAFVEEALRLESPVAALPRWVTRDTRIGDVPVPAGSCVQVSYAAANRDGKQFSCPAQLDIQRSDVKKHMAFGYGPHFCVGSMLARLEIQKSLTRLLERTRDIRIDNDGEPLRHDCKLVVRALESLPVRLSL